MFKLSAENKVLYGFFLLVGQLEAVAVEYLDPIILVRVMRRRNHDAGVGPHTLCNKGYTRRGQHTDQVRMTPIEVIPASSELSSI